MGNVSIKRVLSDRSFLIVALVLLVAALSIKAASTYLKVHSRKERVPLRKPLADFDVGKMHPYRMLGKDRISSDVEEALGTKDYVQIRFEDPKAEGSNSAGRSMGFFVTYYTGDPDQVPHVPDVCYLGGGFEPEGAYNTEITVPGLGLPGDKLPVRLLFFKNSKPLIPVYQTVIYFFSVNGHYAADRTLVRWYLADLWTKYAYFSKVELSFLSQEKPDRDKSLALAERFYRLAVPVLVQEHWADWDALIKK